jgi:zinc protease
MVQEKGVAADELARAKAQLIAGQIYKLDSMFAQAMEIGQLESVGIPYNQNRRMIDKLQAVTAEQVQAVARKYFRDEQSDGRRTRPAALAASAPRARSRFRSRVIERA